jgi:hypothetical protein
MSKNYSDIADFFRTKAREGYKLTEGQYYPLTEIEYLDSPKPLINLQHVFKESITTRLYAVSSRTAITKASDALSTIGLNEFSYVARGSSAICFTSNNHAIRAGVRTSKKPSRTDMGDIRDQCPLILQENHRVYISRVGLLFEVLPFISMIDDREIPTVFQDLVPKLLHQTCFEINNEDKDLGILPDGTPIYVDPGAINLRNWKQQPTAQDFETITENAQKLGWPKDLSWVLPDGKFKQEQFFLKPENSLNLTL